MHVTAGILHGLLVLAATAVSAQGADVTLGVDGWTPYFHSGTTDTSATVVGNDYKVSYDTEASASIGRAYRNWDIAAIPLTSPFTVEFDFRSNTNVASALQTFVIFGSSAQSQSTGPNDSWKITADGGGWGVYNNNTYASLGTGSILADVTWRFTLTIDPVADTYRVDVTNLSTSNTWSLAGLALRNGSDTSLSFLNFVSNGAASQTGLGFSVGEISITTTAVPEPHAAALVLGGILLAGVLARRCRLKA